MARLRINPLHPLPLLPPRREEVEVEVEVEAVEAAAVVLAPARP